MLWAYLTGVIVTVIAALAPARRATHIPPVAALRDDVALPASSLRRRAVFGTLVLAAGLVSMAAGLVAGAGILWVGVGALGIFLARGDAESVPQPADGGRGRSVLPRLRGRPGDLP